MNSSTTLASRETRIKRIIRLSREQSEAGDSSACIRLCLFEIEPREYFGYVENYHREYIVGPFKERLQVGIVARIQARCKREYPTRPFKATIVAYNDCDNFFNSLP